MRFKRLYVCFSLNEEAIYLSVQVHIVSPFPMFLTHFLFIHIPIYIFVCVCVPG